MEADLDWLLAQDWATRDEVHYDGRTMRCYADRPPHFDAGFRQVASACPDGEALVAGRERIRYRELDAIVERVAGQLAARGISQGDRVAVSLGNRLEFAYTVLACARLGAISVPMNPRMRLPENRFALTQCGAAALVHEADGADQIPTDLPLLRRRVTCGGSAPGAEPFEALLDAGPPPPAVVIADEDPFCILYTSGTTGTPKGAVLTHLGVIHSVLHFRDAMACHAGEERAILAVPASHVTGLVAQLATFLLAGGCTIFLPEFKAGAFLELAAAERCTQTILVPAMYNLCLMDPTFDRHDLTEWEIGAFGGAPMPAATIAELARRLPNLVLINAYGATETTSPATIMPLGAIADHPDSIGRVVRCGEIRVVGEDGNPVAPGEAGELWIAGPMVVPGYWNNQAANRDNFTGGFWRSGDVGSIDTDGYVRIFDRKKDMINRGGYKIYSAEVENVLMHHGDVVEAAVIARPDPVLGEKVHCFLVARPDGIDLDDVRGFCAQRLSDYKVPEFFTILDQPLPRNPNGKVVKGVLRDMLEPDENP